MSTLTAVRPTMRSCDCLPVYFSQPIEVCFKYLQILLYPSIKYF